MPDRINFEPNQIELDLELIRLSQARAREHGLLLANELARQVAQAAILNLPEELELMLDEDAAINRSDSLSAALGVNDIVVNGHQIDVRPLSADQTVELDRIFIASPYLRHGSLVVGLRPDHMGSGAVLAYVPARDWLKAAENQQNADFVSMPVAVNRDFDLSALMVQLTGEEILRLPSMTQLSDVAGEVGELLNNRSSLISARQKQIFVYLSNNWSESILSLVESVPVNLSPSKMASILSDSALWAGRVDLLAANLSKAFPTLNQAQLMESILKAGARGGSNLAAPASRRLLLAELVALELQSNDVKSPLGRIQALAEKVLGGMSLAEAVKNVIGNQMAVDLAFAIRSQRAKGLTAAKNAQGFLAATAEELGLAYGQLALAPAYATHSQSPEPGAALDGVNEALALLQTAERLAETQKIDNDLADL